MPSAPAVAKIVRWNDAEYLLLAEGLIGRYPKRNYAAVSRLEDLDFDVSDLNFVQQRALPRNRQRVMQSLDVARRHIFEAIVALRGNRAPVDAPAPVRVTWSDAEWKLFALTLHTLAPDLHFLNSTDLDGLTTTLMNKAAQIMPAGRQRLLAALEVPRARLLDIYRIARAERDPLFYPPQVLPQAPKMQLTARQERMFKRAPGPVLDVTPAPAPDVQAPAVAVPVAPATDPVPAALTLLPSVPASAAAAAAPNRPAGRANVIWTRDEWLLVAAELHRMFPVCHYPDSPDLRGMTSSEVARAQLVLREDRQRQHLKVVSFKSMLRAPLLSAYLDLKNRLASAAAQDGPAPVAVSAPPADAVAALPPPPPYTPPPAVLAAMPVNPYEAAFAPLMGLFAQQVAAQIAPLHAQIAALQASVARLSAVPAPADAPAPFGAIFHPDKPRPAMLPRLVPAAEVAPVAAAPAPRVVQPAAPPRQRIPHIGVVGNRNAYHADLAQEFPGIRFTCIDNAKLMDSVRNCDRVIGMIKWSNHPQIAKAKKAVGERFVPIEGGLSDLKRTISIWIASGVFAGLTGAPAPAPLMGTA